MLCCPYWCSQPGMLLTEKDERSAACRRGCLAAHRVPVLLGHQALPDDLFRAEWHIVVSCFGGRRHHIGFQPAQQPALIIISPLPPLYSCASRMCSSSDSINCVMLRAGNAMPCQRPGPTAALVIPAGLGEEPDLSFFLRPSGNLLPQYSRLPAL